MSLPVRAVERLFERFLATYGTEFSNKWGGAPISDVKSVWADELSGFANRLDAVAWALQNLPERVPNAVQFKALCRMAPAPAAKALPAPPPASPERVSAEMAKLGAVKERVLTSQSVGREWVAKLQERIRNGYNATEAQRAMLKAAQTSETQAEAT